MKFYFRAQSSAHRLVWSGISTEPFCIFHATFEPQGGRTVCRRGWSGVAAELAKLALGNQVDQLTHQVDDISTVQLMTTPYTNFVRFLRVVPVVLVIVYQHAYSVLLLFFYPAALSSLLLFSKTFLFSYFVILPLIL